MGLGRDAEVMQSGHYPKALKEKPLGVKTQPVLCPLSHEQQGYIYSERVAAAESRDQLYLRLDSGSVLIINKEYTVAKNKDLVHLMFLLACAKMYIM